MSASEKFELPLWVVSTHPAMPDRPNAEVHTLALFSVDYAPYSWQHRQILYARQSDRVFDAQAHEGIMGFGRKFLVSGLAYAVLGLAFGICMGMAALR